MNAKKYPINILYGFAVYYSDYYNRKKCNENPLPIEHLLEQYLQELADAERRLTPKNEKIARSVLNTTCTMLGLQPAEVLSLRKYGDIPSARQITCYVLKRMGYKESTIARLLGLQRASVYHRIKAARNFIEVEPYYREVAVYVCKVFGVELHCA